MAIFTYNTKDSDHLKSFSYDDSSRIATVTFEHERTKGPQIYRHKNVPRETFNAWLKWCADGHSAGGYYHKFLKNYPRVVS